MNRVSFVLYETGKFLSEAVSQLKKFKLSGRFLNEIGVSASSASRHVRVYGAYGHKTRIRHAETGQA
jgi:hypothetical protein